MEHSILGWGGGVVCVFCDLGVGDNQLGKLRERRIEGDILMVYT